MKQFITTFIHNWSPWHLRKPDIIGTKLLHNTDWKGSNIGQLLERVAEAKKGVAKFVGHPTKGIIIPLESIIGTESSEDDSTSNDF